MSKPKPLECATCGNITIGRHWWNQDTGYGICDPCAMITKRCPETFLSMYHIYGREGYNYLLKEEQDGIQESYP